MMMAEKKKATNKHSKKLRQGLALLKKLDLISNIVEAEVCEKEPKWKEEEKWKHFFPLLQKKFGVVSV